MDNIGTDLLDGLEKHICDWIMERSAQSMDMGDNMIFW